MLASAITLSYLASEFTVLPLDLTLYHELQEEANPLFNILMQGVSYLGEPAISMALIVITATTFALPRQWLEATFILATTSSVLLTFALKDVIHRARPFPVAENATNLIQTINQYSYPSGHVLFFVVFFGFFVYLAWMQIYWTREDDRHYHLRCTDRSNRTVTYISWSTLGERCYR